MGLFKALFGGSSDQTVDNQKQQEDKQFDTLKYDGIRALRTGHPDLAVRFLSKALEMRDDLEVRDSLSQVCMMTDQLDTAMQQLEVLAKVQPDNILIYLRMAQVAFLMEDYNAMNEACDKAEQIESQNEVALFLHSKAWLGLSETEKALELLDQVLEQNPEHGDAYLLRGNTLLAHGEVDKADADATTLMEMAPENEDVLMLMARVRVRQNRLEDAADLYGRVIDVNPFSRDAFLQRAFVYKELGKEDLAKSDLEEAEQMAPTTETGEPEEVEMKKIDPFGIF